MRRPDITDEEAGAMLRAVVSLFGLWKLTDEQAAILLDAADLKARLSDLIGIHKVLRIVFREPRRGYDWVQAPNSVFGGKSALDVMLGGDLMRIRRYLDSEC
jgi:hypothetical protein